MHSCPGAMVTPIPQFPGDTRCALFPSATAAYPYLSSEWPVAISLSRPRRDACPHIHRFPRECARSHSPDLSTWRVHNHSWISIQLHPFLHLRCISIQESPPQLYIDSAVLSLSLSSCISIQESPQQLYIETAALSLPLSHSLSHS